MFLGKFFHEPPETGRAYGRLRVAYALTAILSLLVVRPGLPYFFGDQGYCPPSADGWSFWTEKLQFSFFNVWGSPKAVSIVWWLALANSIVVLLGLGIRPLLRVFLVLEFLFLSTFFLSPCRIGNYGDQIFVSTAFLMMFLPLKPENGLAASRGTALADARDGRQFSPWLRKTLMLTLCTLYLVPVIARIPGVHWWDGTASWMAFADPMNSRIWRWLAKNPEAIPNWGFFAMTYGALSFEALFPFLIWFKKFRKPLVITGIAFHTLMGVLIDLGLFPLQMMVLLIACLDDGPAPLKKQSNNIEGGR